jgi:hypothetical protein
LKNPAFAGGTPTPQASDSLVEQFSEEEFNEFSESQQGISYCN